MAATIYDVAKRAGVSVATVSRIANGSGKVSAKTAEKVQIAIQELNFRPNALGRNLSTSKTRTIGIVMPSMSNPVFADVVAGINELARQHDYTLMLTMTEYQQDQEEAVIQSLLSYQPEGIILTVADPQNSIALDMLDQADMPHVLIYNQPSHRTCPTLTVDNEQAGADVAACFIENGHQNLAMISGKLDKSDRAAARWQGFHNHCLAHQIPAPQLVEIDFIDPDMDGIFQILQQQAELANIPAPTALFCSNDFLAISVIGALTRAGIRVPEDMAVIGFDGMAISTQLYPSLATVCQPSREMGRAAMQILLSLISGETRTGATILPHSLRLGGSAGSAGKPMPADRTQPRSSYPKDTLS